MANPAFALDEVVLTIDGVVASGFGEGGAYALSYTNELWEHTTTVDGSVVSSKNLDTSATLTVTVSYDSTLSQKLEERVGSRASFDCELALPNGDRVNSGEARVQKAPDITDGMTPGDREWTVFLASTQRTWAAGGSA